MIRRAGELAKVTQRNVCEKLIRQDRYATRESRKHTEEYTAGFNSAVHRLFGLEQVIDNAAAAGEYRTIWREEAPDGNESLASLEGLETGIKEHLVKLGYEVTSEIHSKAFEFKMVMQISWLTGG